MNNKKKLMFLMAFFIGITGIIYSNSKDDDTDNAVVYEDNTTNLQEENSNGMDEDNNSSQTDIVYVYVCGCVVNPGVYSFYGDARIAQAVEAAGGITQNGNAEYVNLATKIIDGQRIYIPSQDEIDELKESGSLGDIEDNNEGLLSPDSGDNSGKININTATKEELTTIVGIGESRAQSIISYREENGRFKSIEDIMNVSGIKDALFNKICEYITV